MAYQYNFVDSAAIPYATHQILTFNRADSSTISLVGRALQFTVQTRDDPTTAILTKSTGAGNIDVLSADSFAVTIAASDTLQPGGIGADVFQYTVRDTDSGAEDILAYGDFEVSILSPAP